jgi:hypothetical protein
MFNVIRRSQIIGLTAMANSTATRYGSVEEVWVDDNGRVVYFASDAGYTPFEQIATIGPDALLTYSELALTPPPSLRRLDQMAAFFKYSLGLGRGFSLRLGNGRCCCLYLGW